MIRVTSSSISAEEFFELAHRSENRDRVLELERGMVIEMSRPGKRHGMICGNVTAILWSYAGERKHGYVCSNDTGIIVERNPDTVRGPDVMFFDDATGVAEIESAFATTPPVVSIEVLSPNDSLGTVIRRVQQQPRFGIRAVWVLDPEACNVTVFRAGRENVIIEEGEELTAEEVLPGFRCRVAEFFKLPGQ